MTIFRILTVLCALGVVLGISGCDAIRAPVQEPSERFISDARLAAPHTLPEVSLSIVKTAEFRMREAFLYSGGRWGVLRTSAHSAVLVRHPRGSLLFDTGLGSHADEQFEHGMPFWLKPVTRYTHHVPVKAVLGDEARAIGRIVLSHMHWDHVSGVEEFPQAEILASRAEHAWATGNAAPPSLYMRMQYDGVMRWRLVDFDGGPYENFDRSQDLFGDGTVVLVPLPGHTPGSLGMFVNLKSGRRFFFPGDAAWTQEGFRIPAHKFWASRLLLDQDTTETERTLLRVARLMRHYPDLLVVPAHDDVVQRTIGFYPTVVR